MVITLREVQLLEVTNDFSQLLEFEDSSAFHEQTGVRLAHHFVTLFVNARTVKLQRDSFVFQSGCESQQPSECSL